MKHYRKLLAAFFIMVFLVNSSLRITSANHTLFLTESPLHQLVEDTSGVTFDVEVPWQQLSLETKIINDKEYTIVSLADWALSTQAGAPALPFLVQEIGAPIGVGVNITVTPGKQHTQYLSSPILPAATQTVDQEPSISTDVIPELPTPVLTYAADAALYHLNADYPAKLAAITNDGMLRQQRVLGIAVTPVQYNPVTMQLTIYETLKVSVRFESPIPTNNRDAVTLESDVYEELLVTRLLNYETAQGWRQTNGGQLSSQMVTPMEGATWTPPSPAWRIKVQEDGFYSLSYPELQAVGVEVDTLDPTTLKLFNLGEEIAISVDLGADAVFNENDTLLFFGQGITSKYTLDNVYWLTYGGEPGRRINTKDGTPNTGITPVTYSAVKRFEEDLLYLNGAPGDEYLDRWMWSYISASSSTAKSWTTQFDLSAPASIEGSLTISLLGFLENGINPDHHVRVTLNDTQIGDVTWDGLTWNTLVMAVPAGLLVSGTNTLVVTCPNDTGVTYDLVYIDWIKLEYANSFLAENDELTFSNGSNGDWKYAVDGFSTDQVTVYDLTDANSPILITGGVTSSTINGTQVEFSDTLSAPIDYWALTSGAFRAVQSIEVDTSSDLQAVNNGADYLLITHKEFTSQADTLRLYRESQGLRAVVVDVQDIYDEFGYGITGVAPIRNFLAYTYTSWTGPAPSFVVLLGDGHYDPKDNLGIGRINFIPAYLAPVDPWIHETAADNRFVMLSGLDNIPEMMVGRLSVNNTSEADAIVRKIIAYEAAPYDSWQQQVLAVADNADYGGEFPTLSDNLISGYLPSPYSAEKVYLGVTHLTSTDARVAIQAAINSGMLVVNYIGHGTTTQWASEGLFKKSDVAGLTNAEFYPIILSMTCSDGFYHYPYPLSDSLAEIMTLSEGKGAVASWSPSGLGVSSGHDSLDQGFFTAAFTGEVETIGEAVMAGKLNLWATGENLDLMDTFTLFGDPATKFPRDPVVPTFTDVPLDHPFYPYIEALYDAGYTSGCGTDPLIYCPEQTMTRAESSVFMMRGNFGNDYVPPAEPWGTFADDWTLGSWAEKWAEGMWDEGMTAGCWTDPLKFCPWEQFNREQAAVFGLRMKYGTSYSPPAASGTVFADMTDTSYWATKWAEQAYADELLFACGTQETQPLFCPNDQVTRAWGAYIVVKAKDLPVSP